MSIYIVCCIWASFTYAQPFSGYQGGELPSLSDVIELVPDPIYSQFGPGQLNITGYVTLPEDATCQQGSSWNPVWWENYISAFNRIPPPESNSNTQVIDCFYNPYWDSYNEITTHFTKQARDFQCMNDPTLAICDYFSYSGWTRIILDRVAGFGNTIAPPPGSNALQHYQNVGAISPNGKMRLRASVASTTLYNPAELPTRNVRYRVSGLDGTFVEVPVAVSEITNIYPDTPDLAHDLDFRVIDVEIPTSLFECHQNGPTSAAIDISLYMELYSDVNDMWVEASLSTDIIDWIAIDWEEVAPVVLVHGISQNSTFWNFTKFGGNTNPPLTYPPNSLLNGNDHGLAYWIPQGLISKDINLRPDLGGGGTVAENAADFGSQLELVAFNLGVDRVHVVAHSKGGLDMRGYLSDQALYNENDPDQIKVISLHTLSTPHEGSVLADIKRGIKNELDDASNNIDTADVAILDFVASIWKSMRQPGEGYNNLTTRWCANFRSTIKDMPKNCVYTTYGDDADIYKDYSISVNEIPNMLNFAQSRGDFWDTQEGHWGTNFAYKRLGTTRHYRVGRETVWVDRPVIGTRQVDRLTVSEIEQYVFRNNDLLVTEISAWGYGGFSSKDYNRGFSVLSGQGHSPAEWGYTGGQIIYGTHIDVADKLVGRNSHVGPSIIAADQKYGFLKE